MIMWVEETSRDVRRRTLIAGRGKSPLLVEVVLKNKTL